MLLPGQGEGGAEPEDTETQQRNGGGERGFPGEEGRPAFTDRVLAKKLASCPSASPTGLACAGHIAGRLPIPSSQDKVSCVCSRPYSMEGRGECLSQVPPVSWGAELGSWLGTGASRWGWECPSSWDPRGPGRRLS